MRDTILHLADLHLDASPEARLDDAVRAWLLGARRRILNALASWIARDESRIGLVLIAGDLFDRHDPPQEVVSEARTALAEIARLVPVVTVPGNHDEYSYAQCVYRRGDWPGVLVTSPEPQLVWKGQLGDSV
ncbi:MAG: metallophosphoesterase, partial [Thermogutta sp.]